MGVGVFPHKETSISPKRGAYIFLSLAARRPLSQRENIYVLVLVFVIVFFFVFVLLRYGGISTDTELKSADTEICARKVAKDGESVVWFCSKRKGRKLP